MTTQTSTSASTLFDRLSTLSYPLIRITAGLLLMPHGAQKLFGWFGGYGLDATGQFFATNLGMEPGFLFALLAGLVEFFGGLALVLGLLTRPAALAIAGLMAVALSVHVANGFFWTSGGVEYPLMWGLIAFAVFLRGGERFSLDRQFGFKF
uniref:DoxX family protein n=1 Tax=Marinobacterium profundum TaxID=1714300 RepID=UPI00082A7BA3|nr:DoxX family protein [Marinobacterium profundum]